MLDLDLLKVKISFLGFAEFISLAFSVTGFALWYTRNRHCYIVLCYILSNEIVWISLGLPTIFNIRIH